MLNDSSFDLFPSHFSSTDSMYLHQQRARYSHVDTEMAGTRALLSELSSSRERRRMHSHGDTHTEESRGGRDCFLAGPLGKLCEEAVPKLCTKDVPGPSMLMLELTSLSCSQTIYTLSPWHSVIIRMTKASSDRNPNSLVLSNKQCILPLMISPKLGHLKDVI